MRVAYYNYINNIISPRVDGCTSPCNKTFWSFIKHLKKDNITIPTLLDNGVEGSDDVSKIEVLNRQFKSAFTNDSAISDLPNKGPSPYPHICHFTNAEEGILHLLSALNIHKTCGPNQINAIFLKQTSTVITSLITKLFQISLHSGEIPNDWKTVYVSPVLKNGDPKIAYKLPPSIPNFNTL